MTKKPDLASLVEAYGNVCERYRINKREKDELKDALVPFCQNARKPLASAHFALQYSEDEAMALDIAAIRKDMPAAWIKKYTVKNTRVTLKAVRIK